MARRMLTIQSLRQAAQAAGPGGEFRVYDVNGANVPNLSGVLADAVLYRHDLEPLRAQLRRDGAFFVEVADGRA